MTNSSTNSLFCHATLEEVSRILQTVTDAARSSGMEEKNIWKLETSMDEACTNIVCYGYKDRADGMISVNWETCEDRFIVTIEDAGVPFDQTEPTNPDFSCDICNRKVGGLGRFIMTQFLDGMSYERVSEGNRLILIKKLRSESEQPAQSMAS
jgi:serine/threonine-protein kinase RsbW